MNALVEITVSDRCNKNCSYCFENRADSCIDRFDEWKPLILKACEGIKAGKISGVDGLQLTFWGGEPFIRFDRMLDLIEITSRYPFVSYHVYTNATLEAETRNFVDDSRFKSVSNRFSAQVSYDGSPCNEKRRGYGFDSIRKQVETLAQAGVRVSFKATVCYDDIELFPQLWDSYESLVGELPDLKYCPTLDSVGTFRGDIGVWCDVVEKLCRREYRFFDRHGRFLMSWFDDKHPRRCRFDNRVFLHTDGVQYICHGCPYAQDSRFKTGTCCDDSLAFMSCSEKNRYQGSICVGCRATYCVYCNLAGMPAGDLPDVWNKNCSANENVCEMYRIFGQYRRFLTYAIIKGK